LFNTVVQKFNQGAAAHGLYIMRGCPFFPARLIGQAGFFFGQAKKNKEFIT